MASEYGRVLHNLKQVRMQRMLNQRELASLADVARSTINRAEAGGVVSYPNIRKLAAALGVEPAELVGEESDHLAVAV